MRLNTINIQDLYDFSIRRKAVDPFDLMTTSESFCRSVKVVGLKLTQVEYRENGREVLAMSSELPEIMRAFAGYLVMLVYCWDDINSGRLEQYLGLGMPIREILYETGVFKTSGADLACVTVAEVIESWAKQEKKIVIC